jgi:hypothetical protein
MREIAPDVFHLPLTPRNGVNAYLLGDVLVDTGLRTSAGRIRSASPWTRTRRWNLGSS